MQSIETIFAALEPSSASTDSGAAISGCSRLPHRVFRAVGIRHDRSSQPIFEPIRLYRDERGGKRVRAAVQSISIASWIADDARAALRFCPAAGGRHTAPEVARALRTTASIEV